jgi:hypothetical protein
MLDRACPHFVLSEIRYSEYFAGPHPKKVKKGKPQITQIPSFQPMEIRAYL